MSGKPEKLVISGEMKEWFIRYQGDLQKRRGKRINNDDTLEDLLKRTRFYQVELRKLKRKLARAKGECND